MATKAKGLTAAGVENAKDEGRYQDRDGLMLAVSKAGARRWLQRLTIRGKRTDLGLGSYPGVSLAEARKLAAANKDIAKAGGDPREERDRQNAIPTFAEAAEAALAVRLAELSNAKHRDQWRSTLATYAFPVIGKKRVNEVTSADVLRVLKPIWRDKTETASRLRGRIETVLDHAAAHGWRDPDSRNPAAWKGVLQPLLPRPARIKVVEHQPGIAWQDAPAWFRAVGQREGIAAKALQFAALTWGRSGEVRGATWGEIDLEAALWTIPAGRMKMRREHRVPLAPAAVELLKSLPRVAGTDLVFPGARGGPLSDMSLSAVLRRMQAEAEAAAAAAGDPVEKAGWRDPKTGRPAVPHGLRSTARTWGAEQTRFDRHLLELALAHDTAGAVEAAYQRSDRLEERRKLAGAWAAFLTGQEAARVIPMARRS